MIEGWDKGPRDRTKRAPTTIAKAMDWIYRLGPQVVIEVRDLNDTVQGTPDEGVIYADLCIGEGRDAHRLPLGPVLYGDDEPDRSPINVPTIQDALRIEERRGREAVRIILERLNEV